MRISYIHSIATVLMVSGSCLILFFAISVSATAETMENDYVLLSRNYFNQNVEVISNGNPKFIAEDGAIRLQIYNEPVYFIHNYDDELAAYDEIRVTLKTDVPIVVTIIPKISSKPKYTFELQRDIPASESSVTTAISTHHSYFRGAEDFAIKFSVPSEAHIILENISIVKISFFQKIIGPFRDFFQVAPYSGFTVNVFATPRIYGMSAFLFILPVVITLIISLFFWKRARKIALICLVVIWLLIDFRMDYEFAQYIMTDYNTWIAPKKEARTLRTYGNYYVFADWIKDNIPAETTEIALQYSANEHFPRLMSYLLYPLLVSDTEEAASVWVLYNRSDLKENLLIEGATEIARFNSGSGIITIE